jgi:2-polyprenyl-3-methyl-5-hydroxy-6-metoxy-1,4-benzoquinol methylase
MFDLDRYEYHEDVNQGVMRRAPTARRVLDVGCGSGLLGREIAALGNEVWGIDNAVAVAEVAGERLTRFLLADITAHDAVAAALGDERFDVLVFADVLEHVFDPVRMLAFYRRFLNPGGTIIVSVPNIAIWNVRLRLLLGRFDYTQTGTLDKTHVRFFTRPTLTRALEAAGFRVSSIDVTPGLLRPFVPLMKRRFGDAQDRRAIIDSRPYSVYLRLFYPLERRLAGLAPGLLAFQYVAVAEQAP